MSNNTNAADPFVNWTADQASQYLLFDIARRFKGLDKVVDARIDAAAERISGKPGIKVIPPTFPGEPRVPLYMEGEPGVGKTSVVKAAIKEFCQITGLNFVENPADGVELGPNDFYFFTVNFSGKNNAADIGGLPAKGQLQAAAAPEAEDHTAWLFSQLDARARALAKFQRLPISDSVPYANGDRRFIDITIKGEGETLDRIVNELVRQVSEEAKPRGTGIKMVREGAAAADNELAIQLQKGPSGYRLIASGPAVAQKDVEYVADMLPNRRFALATKTPFCLVNFDDVANASESVRNILLELAQSNRYSGVADIGNAMVTFTGNMGAEDNTNTQSEQSDAEVTRVMKVRIRDTPKDWAARIARKYNEVGDCMFAHFIEKFGDNNGIFREGLGDTRSARGVPKPNSRSLENAVAKTLPYFQMARASGADASVFLPEISTVVKGTAGAVVAEHYTGFVRSMLSDAIPLADELMSTGKLDVEKFEASMGSNTRAAQQDFAFRFAAALADAYVDRMVKSPAAIAAAAKGWDAHEKLIVDATDRLCTGLARLEPGTLNYALSRSVNRIGNFNTLGSHDGVKVNLNLPVVQAMGKGLAASLLRNIWPDPDQIQRDFVQVVNGVNTAANRSRAKSKATAAA